MTVKTFIDRPILSGVISVMLVIIGLIGLSQLPVEQFPDIAPPTVRVTATYTGANAETVTLPGGNVLRLGDVATVELGAENYALLSQTDGHPGANYMIAQTSGSNANEIIKEDALQGLTPALVTTTVVFMAVFIPVCFMGGGGVLPARSIPSLD